MNRTKHAVIITLFATMQKGETHYTRARIDTILELLQKYHKASVGRRWLFQCLRDIEDAGLIRRAKRYRNADFGEIRQLSSMFAFTMRGVKYMINKRIAGAHEHLDRIISWLKKDDRRFPAANPEIEKFQPLENEENVRRLKRLVYELG